MKGDDIQERTFEFAARVMKMDRDLSLNRHVNRRAMNQRVDSATSIGANLQEARGAQSRADFHAKVRVSLKEARESHYWLRLIERSGGVSPERIHPLVEEANEIVAILTTI